MLERLSAISEMVIDIEPRLNALELKLSEQLKTQQDNVDLIWRLTENYRKQGNLLQALGGCQRLLQLQPDHQPANYLHHLLTGCDLSALDESTGCVPSPFVLFDNFLDELQQQALWQLLEKHHTKFVASTTLAKGGARHVTDYRSSHVLPLKCLKPLRAWFLPLIDELLPTVLLRLGLSSFDVEREELQLTKSQGGDYYKIHSDRGKNNHTQTRYLTFVYYFHGEPKGFAGGDLLLFDTDRLKEHSFNAHFTRVQPINNRLICFPSDCFHTVLPVKSLVDEWCYARFTLNGWLHKMP